MTELEIELRNLAETRKAMLDGVKKLTSSGFEGMMAKGTLMAHRYMWDIVHVDTSRLKNSLFPSVRSKGNTVFGSVGTNVSYSKYEERRGGDHAFARRTRDEKGPDIIAMFKKYVVGAV